MKTFIVLGMHRSATSLAAKGLALAGIHMGDRLLGAHSSNPYGHWEDVDFIYFNDQLLANAGGSWKNPPKESALNCVFAAHKKDIEVFVNSKKREPFWGWKDPRTVLTIRGYLPYIENPHFITCHRSIDDVAGSIYKRGDMPFEDARLLASIYTSKLLTFLAEWQLMSLGKNEDNFNQFTESSLGGAVE